MNKEKTVIVVLNYLNYHDTIECVDSIIRNKYKDCEIIVVDNGSENNSYQVLTKEYENERNVYLIRNKQNLGYAKGNNVGIEYARKKMHAAFVLVVNNDTVFTEKNYILELKKKYVEGVGCIGSNVILRDGTSQGEYAEYISLRDTFFSLVNMHSLRNGSSFDFPTNKGGQIKILHGSAIMFTPDFFKYYKGFYPKTFLYGEEAILYYMCKCKGLKQVYLPDVSIYHKEDQSSAMSFNNDKSVMNEYIYHSRKYVLLWAIRYEIYNLLHKTVKKHGTEQLLRG